MTPCQIMWWFGSQDNHHVKLVLECTNHLDKFEILMLIPSGGNQPITWSNHEFLTLHRPVDLCLDPEEWLP